MVTLRRPEARKLRSVPALWELYDGSKYVGYVESAYRGTHPWAAHFDSEEIGQYATRRSATSAIRKAYLASVMP